MPPSGSPGPGARLTLIRLALSAAPAHALRGMWWVLCGKRVRGWNLLCAAAADHPAHYEQWVRLVEPGIVRAFCAARPRVPHGPIACIVLEGEDHAAASTTVASVRAQLGPHAPILTDSGAPLADAFALLDPGVQWLLPLRAGTVVAEDFSTILDHAGIDRDDTIVYWDEDVLRRGRRADPWIKPGWDPLLHAAADGVTGAGLIAAAAVPAQTGGACGATGVAGIVAGLLADPGSTVRHIPLVLTHRGDDNALVSEAEHHRIVQAYPGVFVPDQPGTWPSVTIIIPTRDRADLLDACLAGLERLDYAGAVDIVIVDNDSSEPRTAALFDRLAGDDRASVSSWPGAFNFAAMINHAAERASGDMVCLLNNDVEPRDGGWLTVMVRHAVTESAGAVGARLLYPDGRVQHAGVAIGVGGAAGHVQKHVDPADPRFATWHGRTRRVTAVTAACLVVTRAKFASVGGMDAARFAVDFNDVDLCLRLQERGLTNIVAVEATLIHHESTTRGQARTLADRIRFAAELAALQTRWGTLTRQDPHHSPLFRRESERCILRF